jgi:hypothetical protein
MEVTLEVNLGSEQRLRQGWINFITEGTHWNLPSFIREAFRVGGKLE